MDGIFDNLEFKNESTNNVNHTDKKSINNNESNLNKNIINKEPAKKMTIIRNSDPNIKIESEETENTIEKKDENNTYNNGIEILELHDKVYYEVIMNLRTSDGIDLIDFKNKYNKELKDYYDYSSLVEEKIIKLENNRLVIPENLWYISNSVIVKLLDSEVIK